MINKNLKITANLLLVILILASIKSTVFAINSSLNMVPVSSTVEKGDDVRIDLELRTDVSTLSSFGEIEISFDSSLFTFTSAVMRTEYSEYNDGLLSNVSNGKVYILWSHPSGGNLGLSGTTSKIVRVYFKANNTGSGQFQILKADGFKSDESEGEIYVAAGDPKRITVIAPVIKSDNNNLKSLEVSPGTLTPAFAAGTTSYGLAVGIDTDKVTVSAAPADSKASVAVSGNDGLIYGENQVKVVVTAENGNKKTYTITVTRAAPSPSPSPSPTPAVTINQPDGKYTIVDPPEGTAIPGGFYSTLDNVGGQSVPAFRAIKGDLTLYYLQTEGGAKGFYYLDATSGEYRPFLALSLPAIAFPVLSPDASVTIPQGFTETTIDLNGIQAGAWQSSDLPDGQVLLYLMNNDGEKSFYVYDASRRLLSVYAGISAPSETTETSVTETTIAPTTVETGETTVPAGFSGWALIALLLGVLCLMLLGVIIWLIVRNRGGEEEPPARPKSPTIRRVE